MLTCIACSKQLDDGDDDTQRSGTPAAVKSLSSQIKDMVLKFSGVYRQCKPSATSTPSSSSLNKSQRYSSYVADGDEGPARDARSGRWKNQPCKGASIGTSGQDGLKMNPYEVWSQGNPQREAVDAAAASAVVEEFEEAREWVAQVEPGVHITFLALPQGGNDLKRIRFSREMFNKWQAQRWWGENYDKVMELYNVQRFNRQALPTPPRSEDERSSPYSRVGSTRDSPAVTPPWGNDPLAAAVVATAAGSRAPTATSTTVDATKPATMFQKPSHDETATAEKPARPHNSSGSAGSGAAASSAATSAKGDVVSGNASRTTSSHDEASASASNASDAEVNEWVEQDEPGVYITVRQQPDGTRELRRVRFSRERFGEVHAKLWWEENRERIHAQYL